ncbi:hypothetical protein CHU92_14650 [Flavobacterium cyanobacteriorum]|uniref:NodB homology domain-containing protein n=2 Tax=Flavobacterium cyanobacteriorum TaxID=2022802 RepID=A0A255YSB9_9FLAO|nr:hypothetical protein CHU92_14650 [Flavobacterium cyanobacteriorum]
MPSKAVYEKLEAKGVLLHKNPYNRYDSLETAEDLEALYTTLIQFQDSSGNHPVITTNFVTANPDFIKIKDSGFASYSYEPFTETYKSYPGTESSWKMVQEGMANNFIKPQFHGREHLNVKHWLMLLEEPDTDVLNAFNEKVFCMDIQGKENDRSNLMASFDFKNTEEQKYVVESLKDGLQLFESIFGYRSSSMIAPCNVWDDSAEKVAKDYEVKYIQSLRGRFVPQMSAGYKREYPAMGEKNQFGQYYFIRNAYFEPSTNKSYDWVGNCIKKIDAAFFWNKPAIISTHRLNFIGAIEPENRKRNLEMFSVLLRKIQKKWPEAEFISTDALGELYEKQK